MLDNTFTQLQIDIINRLAAIEQEDNDACSKCGGEDCACCERFVDRQKWADIDQVFYDLAGR